MLDERVRDIGLNVGETDCEIGFEAKDPIDPGTRESRHLGLLLACLRRAHGEARNAGDAVRFSERVKHFGRFFRQADDAFRKSVGHEIRYLIAKSGISAEGSRAA